MATRVSQYRAVAPALVEQRVDTRHRILVRRGATYRSGEQPVEAALHDLSVYGCRLASPAPHEEGDRLWLQLGGGPVGATVVWTDADQIGCRFDAPIDRALMRKLTLIIC